MEQRMLQSLLRPEAYDECPRNVELRQTHISYLFFTDMHVYKVKKPVNMGFLNFSSIDRRRFYCHEEVRLNRRLSPDIYLGVEEVLQTADGASFTGSGKVIDYAVKMLRLPEDLMLDRLIDAGLVDTDDIRRIALKVADFHAVAELSQVIDEFGSLEVISRNWEENFTQVAPFIGATIHPDVLQFIQSRVARIQDDNSAVFAERVSSGHIRDCDGDLHLENICLGENVWIFDCIEFNNRFRYCDTASDIAFLLMDLDFHDRADLAEAFLDEYCLASNDIGSRKLIDFYKVYRAFVRGKVVSMQILDNGIPQSQRDVARNKAIAYFRLAKGYLLRSMLPKSLVMVGGLMGSGKSTVARMLGRELGISVLSSDRIRKELFASDMSKSADFSDGIYAPEADLATYAEIARRCVELLRCSKSVIIDATFRRAPDRSSFREIAAAEHVPCLMFMTDAPDEVIRMRLSDRESRPDEYSDGRLSLFNMHRESFEFPDPASENFISVQTDCNPEIAVDSIISAMRSEQ